MEYIYFSSTPMGFFALLRKVNENYSTNWMVNYMLCYFLSRWCTILVTHVIKKRLSRSFNYA